MALDTWKPVVVYIRSTEITHDYQWQDIASILNFGIINSGLEMLLLKKVSETCRNKMHDYGIRSLSLRDLNDIFRTNKFINLVISTSTKYPGSDDPEDWLNLYDSFSTLGSASSIVCIRNWHKESISYFVESAIREVSPGIIHEIGWLRDFTWFIFNFVEKLTANELAHTGYSIKCSPDAIKNTISTFVKIYSSKSVNPKIEKIESALRALEQKTKAIHLWEEDYITSSNRALESSNQIQLFLKEMVKLQKNNMFLVKERLVKILIFYIGVGKTSWN